MINKRILSIALTAALCMSVFVNVQVYADDQVTKNGVTKTVVAENDITTVTQTRTASEGDKHFYIGEVETDNLLSVTVSISADSGGSNVTGGLRQDFLNETYGIIYPADYDSLFAELQFMPWVSNVNDEREADITEICKRKG